MRDLKILTHPHPLLRQVAASVTLFDAPLRAQFEALDRAMRAGAGGVGIAAPQLGISARMVVVDCSLAQRPCKHHGRLWMANPEIVEREGESLGREGCLSVPDWVALVPRAKRIVVTYDDLDGAQQVIQCQGFEARVIQHEVDHLNGILFIDRVITGKALMRRMVDRE